MTGPIWLIPATILAYVMYRGRHNDGVVWPAAFFFAIAIALALDNWFVTVLAGAVTIIAVRLLQRYA